MLEPIFAPASWRPTIRHPDSHTVGCEFTRAPIGPINLPIFAPASWRPTKDIGSRCPPKSGFPTITDSGKTKSGFRISALQLRWEGADFPCVETTQPSAEAAATTHAGKYLTFQVGDENYGIPVLRTREIIRLPKITPVPQMPAHVRGVVNLRGRVIPVVDLRTRFGLPDRQTDERTCIVVVHLDRGENRHIAMGLVVDAVDEVANLTAADIEPTPDFASGGDTSHIVGMAKVKGAVKALLDLDRLLAA